jgi:hypothetical protein
MVYGLLYTGRHPRYARPAAGFSPASSFLPRGRGYLLRELAHDQWEAALKSCWHEERKTLKRTPKAGLSECTLENG